jgi:uncharacterized protein YdeI (YjbR/CyaY-like superfamily)
MKNIDQEKNFSKPEKNDLQITSFNSSEELESWLGQNFNISKGIWLRFYKKGSGIGSITYPEAVDAALCYGWIDGQLKTYDENSYIQKFTPRRQQSIWSKRNIEHVARLEKEGKMRPSGLKEAETAKADGRWGRAYDPPSTMTIPEDFFNELSKNKKATAFFETLNKANKYAIMWRLQTAKKVETREKRMKAIFNMLEKGEKFHD